MTVLTLFMYIVTVHCADPAGHPAGVTSSVYRFRFTASVIISSTVVMMREFAW